MQTLVLVLLGMVGFCKSLMFLLTPDVVQSIPWDASGVRLAVSAQAVLAGLGLLYAGPASRMPRFVGGFGLYALCVGIVYSLLPAAMWATIIDVSIGFAGAYPITTAALSGLISAVMLWSAVPPRHPGPVDSATPDVRSA